eukprot:1161925-Pelagomonas_calceolata.AAC.5
MSTHTPAAYLPKLIGPGPQQSLLASSLATGGGGKCQASADIPRMHRPGRKQTETLSGRDLMTTFSHAFSGGDKCLANADISRRSHPGRGTDRSVGWK